MSQMSINNCRMIVEVFKTNVQDVQSAKRLQQVLLNGIVGSQVTFDLEDRDRVMRVVTPVKCKRKIESIVASHGFVCEELSD